jgi:fused signal recognition particle receptor
MAFNWFKKKEKQFPDTPVEAQTDPANETENEKISEPETTSAANPESLEEKIALNQPDVKENSVSTAQSNGFFSRLKQGKSKTRDILTTDIEDLFSGKSGVDDDMLEELEELLITSDMGVSTTMDLMQKIEKKASKISGPKELQQTI